MKAGVSRIIARIAEERHATLPSDTLAPVAPPRDDRSQQFTKLDLLIVLFFVIVFVVGFISWLLSDFRGPRGGGRGRGGWSGWSSGVGGFGGGWGGGFGAGRRRRLGWRRGRWQLGRIRWRQQRRWRRRRKLVALALVAVPNRATQEQRAMRPQGRANTVQMLLTTKVPVLGALVLGVLLSGSMLSGCSYNQFAKQEEAIKAQWAQVENQLQRRNDLIPNLVETVKGFAAQEKAMFGRSPSRARKLAGAKTPDEKIEAANAAESALARCWWSSRTIRSSSRTRISTA